MESGSELLKEVYLLALKENSEHNLKLETMEVLKQFKDVRITGQRREIVLPEGIATARAGQVDRVPVIAPHTVVIDLVVRGVDDLDTVQRVESHQVMDQPVIVSLDRDTAAVPQDGLGHEIAVTEPIAAPVIARRAVRNDRRVAHDARIGHPERREDQGRQGLFYIPGRTGKPVDLDQYFV